MRVRDERRSAWSALLPALVAALLVGPLGVRPATAGAAAGAAQADGPVVTHPAAGEQVARAPARVRLVFARMLDPAASTLTVTGPGGPAGLGPARVSGRSIVVVLVDGLPAGTYTATWRVGLRDGAASSGAYRFTLAAPGGRGLSAWVAPAVSGLLLAGLVGAGLLAFGPGLRRGWPRRRPRRRPVPGPGAGPPAKPGPPSAPPAVPVVPAVATDGPDPAMATTLPIRVPGSTAARRIPVSRPTSAPPAWWLPRREPDDVTGSATAARREADPPRR
jgi:methionine-rich copper-binding protein CopC